MDGHITKKYVMLTLLPLLLLIPLAVMEAQAQTSTSQLTITGTCGVTPGTAVNFGSLAEGDASAIQTLTLTKTGVTTPATLDLRGADWLDTGDVSKMVVGQTHYDETGGQNEDFATMAVLTTADAQIYNPFTGANDLDMLLEVALSDTGFAGTLSQILTFTVAC